MRSIYVKLVIMVSLVILNILSIHARGDDTDYDEWDPGDDTYENALLLTEPGMEVHNSGVHRIVGDDCDWVKINLQKDHRYRFWIEGTPGQQIDATLWPNPVTGSSWSFIDHLEDTGISEEKFYDIWNGKTYYISVEGDDDDYSYTIYYQDITHWPENPGSVTYSWRILNNGESLELQWEDLSDNETGFRIERYTYLNDESEWLVGSLVEDVDANIESYIDDDLQEGRYYSYRIRSFNDEGYSEWCNFDYEPLYISHPATPDGIIIDHTDEYILEVGVTLPGVSEPLYVGSFDVQKRRSGGDWESASFYNVIIDHDTYEFRVRSKHEVGYSSITRSFQYIYSDWLYSQGFSMNSPVAPFGFRVKMDSETTCRLLWSDNSDNEEGFRLEYSEVPNVWETVMEFSADTTEVPLSVGNLSPGWYRIAAINQYGTSSSERYLVQSAEKVALPTDLTVERFDSETVRVSWDDNAWNETGYYLNAREFGERISLDADTTFYEFSDISIASHYFLYVMPGAYVYDPWIGEEVDSYLRVYEAAHVSDDDPGNDNPDDTPTFLSLGEDISRTLSLKDHDDWYYVTLDSEFSYNLFIDNEEKGQSCSDVYMLLYKDPHGDPVDFWFSPDRYKYNFPPALSGTYYLRVAAVGNGSWAESDAAYSLGLCQFDAWDDEDSSVITTESSLSFDDQWTLHGLHSIQYYDYYTRIHDYSDYFIADWVAGATYAFYIEPDQGSLALYIYNENHALITSVWVNADSSYVYVPEQDGTYYIRIVSWNSDKNYILYNLYTKCVDSDFDADDCDGDGIPNDWESEYGLDPLDPSDRDTDIDEPEGDGLSNYQEWENGTDPLKWDTDGDGMPDGWEIQYGLDPTSPDGLDGADGHHDDDTISNLLEYQLGSNPNDGDTDGDGLSDDMEAFGVDESVNLMRTDALVSMTEYSYLDRINDGDTSNGTFFQLNNGNEIEITFDSEKIITSTCLVTYEYGDPNHTYIYSLSYLGQDDEWRSIDSEPFVATEGSDTRNFNLPLYTKALKLKAITAYPDYGSLNIREFECYGGDPLGTSITNPDTDDDGLTDFEEVENELFDPLNPDSDGDGIQDGWETEDFLTMNVEVLSDDSVQLTWEYNLVDEVDGFLVEKSSDPLFKSRVTFDCLDNSMTTHVFEDVQCGTVYFRVQADKDNDYSPCCIQETQCRECNPPETPSNFEATVDELGMIHLTWQDNSDREEGYHLFYWARDPYGFTQYDRWREIDLEANTIEYIYNGPYRISEFRIAAYDRDGNSDKVYLMVDRSTACDLWDTGDDEHENATEMDEPDAQVSETGTHIMFSKQGYDVDWFKVTLKGGHVYEFWIGERNSDNNVPYYSESLGVCFTDDPEDEASYSAADLTADPYIYTVENDITCYIKVLDFSTWLYDTIGTYSISYRDATYDPAAPAFVSVASEYCGNAFRLDWDDSSDNETGFNIQGRGIFKNLNGTTCLSWKDVTNVTEDMESYLDVDVSTLFILEDGTQIIGAQYHPTSKNCQYRIRSFNEYGSSEWVESDAVTYDPLDDGDEIPVSWELLNGLDPCKRDGYLNTDGDGLDAYEEYLAGTNPDLADTDGDGVDDDDEINNGTDPLVWNRFDAPAMWVWSMSEDIVMETHEYDREDFYSFVAAPHGDVGDAVETLFMSIPPEVIETSPAKVREFIADAHSRGLKVEFLSGDPTWALSMVNEYTSLPYNQPSMEVLQLVLDFNAASSPEERFDGVQYDVEPYLLTFDNGYPVSWENSDDRAIIWDQYCASLVTWQGMVDDHNTSADDDVRFGAAIPFYWENGDESTAPANHQAVQSIVDYIAIMDYSVNAGDVVDRATDELAYAESIGKQDSVYIGLESIEISWRELSGGYFEKQYLRTVSFHDSDNAALQSAVDYVEGEVKEQIGYAGMALHYYEDVRHGERAYRALAAEDVNEMPVATLIFPSGGETLSGNATISYAIYDKESDACEVELQISTDSGVNWTTLPEVDRVGDAMSDADGKYEIDTTAYTPGTNYQLKIVVTETSSGRSSEDRSDSSFAISAEATDTIAPTSDQAAIQVSSEHPTPHVHVSWTGFSDEGGIKGYYYGATGFSEIHFTRTTEAWLDFGTALTGVIWVWAVDYAGNMSDEVVEIITVNNDMDGDGIADVVDMDADGDGVLAADEWLAECDLQVNVFPYERMVGAWEFEEGVLDNGVAASGFELEVVASKGIPSYISGESIFGNPDKVMQFGASNPVWLRGTGDLLEEEKDLSAITIEMWIKPEATSKYIPLAFIGDMDVGLSFVLQDYRERMCVRVYNGGVEAGQFTSAQCENTALFDDEWHHVACSYNGYEQTITLYIDGVQTAERRSSKIPATLGTGESFQGNRVLRLFDPTSVNDENNGTVYSGFGQFGNNLNWEWTSVGCYYAGLVDDIRISLADVVPELQGCLKSQGHQSLAFSQLTDTDGDGLTDFEESVVYKTDLLNVDTDSDSMPDGWEVTHNLLPAIASDAQSDTDGDTLTAYHEYLAGTNPADPDSDLNGTRDDAEDFDNDGLTVAQECAKGTDPLDADTDHDGWDDDVDPDPTDQVWMDWGGSRFGMGRTYQSPYWPEWVDGVSLDNFGEWNEAESSFDVGRTYSKRHYIQLNPSALNEQNLHLWTKVSTETAGAVSFRLGHQFTDLNNNLFNHANNAGYNYPQPVSWLTDSEGEMDVYVPISDYPTADRLYLHRMYYEVSWYDSVLFIDNEGDGIADAQLEAVKDAYYQGIATDFDKDGLNDYYEWDDGRDFTRADSDGYGTPGGELGFSSGPVDLDNDGLSNQYEFEHMLNPFKSDTDGDEWSDDWEIANGFDPRSDDTEADDDLDTLSNKREYEMGTDHTCPDTDHDGWNDNMDPDPCSRAWIDWGSAEGYEDRILRSPYWPAWLDRVEMPSQGEWDEALSAFTVASSYPNYAGTPYLYLNQDELESRNLSLWSKLSTEMSGKFYFQLRDDAWANLCNNVLSHPSNSQHPTLVRTTALYENDGEIQINVPISDYPTATRLRFHRYNGALCWYDSAIYIDDNLDGIEDSQYDAVVAARNNGKYGTDNDHDQDGLDDYEELERHMDFTCADENGNGIPDGEDIVDEGGGETGFSSGPVDSDGDGLSNSYEWEHYLNPFSADSDGDGFYDRTECMSVLDMEDNIALPHKINDPDRGMVIWKMVEDADIGEVMLDQGPDGSDCLQFAVSEEDVESPYQLFVFMLKESVGDVMPEPGSSYRVSFDARAETEGIQIRIYWHINGYYYDTAEGVQSDHYYAPAVYLPMSTEWQTYSQVFDLPEDEDFLGWNSTEANAQAFCCRLDLWDAGVYQIDNIVIEKVCPVE